MKKHLSKLLVLILCSIMVISTVACSGNGNPASQTPSKPQVTGDEFVKVFIVGDSTVADFSNDVNDNYRYYPRTGYGVTIGRYFNYNVEVVNLALSGYSSLSFIKTNNYEQLKHFIKEGDYLIIGFGHNDQAIDDPARYSPATGDVNQEGSFKYNLYNYYIKLALDVGATPILCTPIVRRTSDYSTDGAHVHIRPEEQGGNYPQAIRDLGEEKDVTVIDLTQLTKDLYTGKGYEGTKIYHSTRQVEDLSELSPDNPIDNTHTNAYGAAVVSYLLVTELQRTDNTLKYFINETKLVEPTPEFFLRPNLPPVIN